MEVGVAVHWRGQGNVSMHVTRSGSPVTDARLVTLQIATAMQALGDVLGTFLTVQTTQVPRSARRSLFVCGFLLCHAVCCCLQGT